MSVTLFEHMSKVCAKALRLSLRPEAVRCGARGSCRRASGGGRSQSLPQRYLGQPSPHTHPHLIRAGEVPPGLSQAEFAWRRQRLASLVRARAGPGAPPDPPDVIIVLSHPVRYMTNDIPYPFHQNQDFLYLTGILEPDCALVMYGSATPDRTVLLVPRRDPARELWDGPRSGRDGAAALSGVERVLDTDELGALLRSLRGGTVWYDASPPCHPQLHHTHVRPLLDGGAALKPLRALTHSLRAVKSPAELLLMQEAGRITSQAFKKTMAMSRANIDEAVLYAKFDFECRAHGANFLAYPPVVAGGNRANTLHYISNNQLVKDGELVLLDGGCEVFGYVSDVTRSWPVNGRFSAAQAELYEAVLEVQSELLAQCHPGVSLEQLYCSMLALLGRQLKELRLLPQHLGEADALKAARRYCPHHVGHYLGMDVHDTPDLSRSQPLQPHMVITIEPGLYVSEDDCSAPERFRGLAVRIEDDVVIRDTGGPLVLSADTPKTLRQVESACAAGRH